MHYNRLKKIKLENVYLLYLIFWLKLFAYQDLKYKFSKVSTKLQPLPLKVLSKNKSFNVTLIINTFLSKSITKT